MSAARSVVMCALGSNRRALRADVITIIVGWVAPIPSPWPSTCVAGVAIVQDELVLVLKGSAVFEGAGATPTRMIVVNGPQSLLGIPVDRVEMDCEASDEAWIDVVALEQRCSRRSDAGPTYGSAVSGSD